MKKTVMILIMAVISTALIFGTAMAADKYEALAKNELAPIGMDKTIVKYTRAKNKQGESMDHINMIDKVWKSEAGEADYMMPFLEGKCSDHLRDIVAERPYLMEIFVMDDQGALVCETDKTGDYMQGDEAKWQKSFADGNGAIFVDQPEFDEGFGTDVLQISVPVMYKGKAIGAITFGVFANKVM